MAVFSNLKNAEVQLVLHNDPNFLRSNTDYQLTSFRYVFFLITEQASLILKWTSYRNIFSLRKFCITELRVAKHMAVASTPGKRQSLGYTLDVLLLLL